MRLIFATALASFGSIFSVAAADIMSQESVDSFVSRYDWSGFYIGGNSGYSWNSVDATRNSVTTSGALVGLAIGTFDPAQTFTGPDRSSDLDGAFGGFQVGYNRQNGVWVYGVEADYQFGSINGSEFFLGSPQGPMYENSAELRHFGTVRGRFGHAFDTVLVYGTGGLALGRLETDTSITGGTPDAPATTTYTDSESRTLVGYTVGAGVEAAIGRSNWTVKGEYLYADFGGEDFALSFADSGGSTAFAHTSVDMQILRIGLNYRF